MKNSSQKKKKGASGLPKRTIKSYSSELSDDQYKALDELFEAYSSVRNHFYQRYSGISSMIDVLDHNAKIRDVLVDKKVKFILPSRLWKCALDDVIGNIKSMWTNTLNECSVRYGNHQSLNDNERHYLYYMLKARPLLANILHERKFDVPDKINYEDLDFDRMNMITRRMIRLLKPRISNTSKARTIVIDSGCYTQKDGCIHIQSLVSGKRISIKLTSKIEHKSTARILFDRDKRRIEVHSTVDLKPKKLQIKEPKRIGIDVNYSNVATTNCGAVYGDGCGAIYTKNTKKLQKQIEKQQDLLNLKKSLIVRLNTSINEQERKSLLKRISNLNKKNLGKKRYERERESFRDSEKSIMRSSLREMITSELPTEIVVEKLGKRFKSSSNNRIKNRKVQYCLSAWQNGEISDTLDYWQYLYGFKLTHVNASYTSQICSQCGHLQGRSTTDYSHCKECGCKLITHHNSAKVIYDRADDKEITVNMSNTRVKKILEGRQKKK